MKLYWKDIEIPIGASVQVIEPGGDGFPRKWKILEIKEKKNNAEYYEPSSGKSFVLKKVMKNKRLYKKSAGGKLIQIPPCKYFLIIEESMDGAPVIQRCFNVDFLSTLLYVKII